VTATPILRTGERILNVAAHGRRVRLTLDERPGTRPTCLFLDAWSAAEARRVAVLINDALRRGEV